MKIKALSTLIHNGTNYRPGAIVEVTETEGTLLIRSRDAEAVVEDAPAPASNRKAVKPEDAAG